MQDLSKERNDIYELLTEALTLSRDRGIQQAKAEREYRIALNKRILSLRDEKVPVTIINDLARGYDDVANLRYDRDIANVLYNSSQEAINVYKLQLKIIEAQINREWGAPNIQAENKSRAQYY